MRDTIDGFITCMVMLFVLGLLTVLYHCRRLVRVVDGGGVKNRGVPWSRAERRQ